MEMPNISIIIPCYNHGHYIEEAVNSVKQSKTKYTYEIIVVNDGSTDPYTIRVLNKLDDAKVVVHHQANEGLGAARNNGIRAAKGEFILPLDSDNLICDNFIEVALNHLTKDDKADIIYTDVELFGEYKGKRKLKEFDIFEMLYFNYIDACAIYRKCVWEKNGGYATDMPGMGHEDWEFWIRSYFNDFEFEYLNILGYKYRTANNSMLQTVTAAKFRENQLYILEQHAKNIALKVYNKLYERYADAKQKHASVKEKYHFAVDHPVLFYFKSKLEKKALPE